MKRKLQIALIALILVFSHFFYIYIYDFCLKKAEGSPGRKEISIDLARHGLFALKGKWLFVPNRFLGPGDDFSGAEQADPGTSWTGVNILPLSPPKVQYGTYRMYLDTPYNGRQMAFSLPLIQSAYRLFVNGKLIAENGMAGADVSREKPEIRTKIVQYYQSDSNLDIILQISNNTGKFERQLDGSIKYGTAEKISSYYQFINLFSTVKISVLLVLAAIFLVRFFAQKKEGLSALFLFLLFLSNCMYQLLASPAIICNFFPIFSGLVYFRLKVSLYAIGFVHFYGFLYAYFGGFHFRRTVHWPVIIISAAVQVLIWVLPPEYAGVINFFYSAALILTGFLFFILLFVYKLKKTKFEYCDGLQFAGYFLFMLAVSHDALYSVGILNTFPFYHLGLMLFGFMEFLVLAEQTFTSQSRFNRISSEIRRYEKFADEFYGYASHELRNPIHSIVGLAESLLISTDENKMSPDQRMSIAQIAASGMRLSNQVNDLIDFSRIRTRNLSINANPLDIYQIIELTMRITQPLTSMKNITVQNLLPRDTPEVIGDEGRLEQVLYSFIMLGLRFMDEGNISFRAVHDDDFLKLSVSYENEALNKTGFINVLNGISDDNVEIEGFENSALSLIVIKEVLRLHKTDLDYTTNAEGLFQFRFLLPLSKVSHEDLLQESMDMNVLVNLEEIEDRAEEVKPMTIMVADDNIVDLQIMINFLRQLEINIKSKRDGESALKEVMENPPDLLLLDVILPRMNGYDVCKKIREKYNSSQLPVILVNNREKGFDMMQSLSVGANDFIVKPVNGEELLARVKTHLQLSRVSSLYSKFVPKELIHSLGRENILEMQLGDQVQQDMTVFFADIRQFTRLSESMTPKENFKFINSYLARISPIIQKHNGFIDKYIGDSIMALYPENPDDALHTAIEMMQHIHVYNGHRANSGYKPIKIGVGIHTGKCIMGVIGDGERMQGTVISDAVNLASRVQDVTKLYGANIIISQDTFVRLDNPLDYNFRFLGKAKVKGKEQTVSLFEIFDGDVKEQRDFKVLTKVDFETAVLLFAKQQFAEAVEQFQKIVRKNPEDQAAVLFLDRSQKLLAISANLGED
ncbi:MAG: response regulator [Spirochaetales bacterium]|nr:response regulator [Spirochaetales bacterium]